MVDEWIGVYELLTWHVPFKGLEDGVVLGGRFTGLAIPTLIL